MLSSIAHRGSAPPMTLVVVKLSDRLRVLLLLFYCISCVCADAILICLIVFEMAIVAILSCGALLVVDWYWATRLPVIWFVIVGPFLMFGYG